MKKFIKKYLPDILILFGIYIFAFAQYFPVSGGESIPNLVLGYDYTNHFKLIGIVLFTTGIDITIRKVIKKYKII